MSVNTKTGLNRSDLLRALSNPGSNDRRDDWAYYCGFEPKKQSDKSDTPKEEPINEPKHEPDVSPPKTEDAESKTLAYWRIKSAVFREDEEFPEPPAWFREARSLTRERLHAERTERPFPYLTPWSRLWPFLKKELSLAVPGPKIDIRRSIRLISECRAVRKLPRQTVRRWPQAIHLLADSSDPMTPFIRDMEQVIEKLRTICGRHRLKIFVFPMGFAGPFFRLDRETPIRLSSRLPGDRAGLERSGGLDGGP